MTEYTIDFRSLANQAIPILTELAKAVRDGHEDIVEIRVIDNSSFTIITKNIPLVTCPHCDGDGEIKVVDYPASGAEIVTRMCGVCHGERKVTPLERDKYFNRMGVGTKPVTS